MKLYQCMFYKNRCYSNSSSMTPTKIVLHSTGCNNNTLRRYVQPHDTQTTGMLMLSPEQKTYTRTQMINLIGKNKYSTHWNKIMYNSNGTENKVCVHAFIGLMNDGSIATIQVLPWTLKCWGVGGGKNGSYNTCAIQFEICEDDHSSADYCNKTFEEAAEFCAYLMKQFPTITEIVSHDEARIRGYGSAHIDPTNWWPKHNKSMDKFRARVNELLKEMGTKPSTDTTDDGFNAVYTVKANDTLYKIANAYNTTVALLIKYNNIENPNVIHVGQKLKVPGKAPTVESHAYGLKNFIMDVQRVTGSAVDGIAGNETIKNTVTVSSRKNKSHAVVKFIQKRLYELGYTEVGEADGIAGPKFTKAVKNFQKANDCVTDGEVTARNLTWRKLLGMA